VDAVGDDIMGASPTDTARLMPVWLVPHFEKMRYDSYIFSLVPVG
jgi:hypothetical protein